MTSNHDKACKIADELATEAVNELAHEDAQEEQADAASRAYENNWEGARDYYMSEEYDSLFDEAYAEALADLEENHE